ncbi:MAG: hypothetical protein V4495_02445 [Pseudomonadota bacterium]
MSKFSSGNSLGSRAPEDVGTYLNSIGDTATAAEFMSGQVSGQGLFGPQKAWKHTGAILGFLQTPAKKSSVKIPIHGASKVTGDTNIIGKRVKISLDKFYVSEYPGNGTHLILCEFTGKNQMSTETEELHFALRFNANDRTSASLNGVPIFMGVTVGNNGISFEGRSINVNSSGDENVLDTLGTPAFQNGLGLLLSAQPALKPFTSLATAVVKTIANKSKNAQIHNFSLGLDFEASGSSANLQYGSYVVVQCDDTLDWDWSKYEWNRDTNMIELKDKSGPFAFNFMVFGLVPFEEQDTATAP